MISAQAPTSLTRAQRLKSPLSRHALPIYDYGVGVPLGVGHGVHPVAPPTATLTVFELMIPPAVTLTQSQPGAIPWNCPLPA
jgi:hypothetical protein